MAKISLRAISARRREAQKIRGALASARRRFCILRAMTSRDDFNHERSRRVFAVLAWLLVANLAVVGAKAVVGWRAGSLSVLSDAVHSLTDACNNVIGIFLIRLANRPPDREHPYGHGKIEQIGTFVITGAMLLTAYEIGREAVVGLVRGAPQTVAVSSLTLGVMLATLGVNVVVVWYERREGKRLNSLYLIADAQHTFSDVIVTGGVLVGLAFVRLGFTWVDRAVALLVTLVIGWGAVNVIRNAVAELMDTAAVDPQELTALALQFADVAAVKDVRSRGKGAYGFVEMTIMINHNDLRRAHQCSEALEEKIRRIHRLNVITVHIEPHDGEVSERTPVRHDASL
jgi:cation diffusion facilitator family transporter